MTTSPLACPTCAGDLVPQEDAAFRCQEDHRYTINGLALTTNIAALNALWLAIRALERDGAALHFMAQLSGKRGDQTAEARRTEADAAYEAANTLRVHARRAQQRLETLPVTAATIDLGNQHGGNL